MEQNFTNPKRSVTHILRTIKLSNDYVEFEFDCHHGSLLQITNLTTNQAMLQDATRARLFRIMCPDGKWYSRYADSQDSILSLVEQHAEQTGHRLTFHYDSLQTLNGPADIAVTITVFLPHDAWEAQFQIKVTNQSTRRLQEIRFPWVAGWTGFDGREVDKAYAGIVPMPMYPDEKETFTHNIGGSRKRRFVKYTVGMQLPFFDVSGKNRGLSYICYQNRPRLGGMLIENLNREPREMSMSWSWVHYPFVKPQQTWTSPVIGIGVHAGNWQQTADHFKKWLHTWWKPVTSPDRLFDTLGMQAVQIRGLDGKPNYTYKDIPEIAKQGLRYGINDLSVWDVNTQVYMRPDDGDIWDEIEGLEPLSELKKRVDETKALGVNLNTMVNYRLIRQQSSLYKQIGEKMVMRNWSGTPTTEDASHYSYNHAELLSNYLSHDGRALCQILPEFRKRSMELTQKTKDLGFTSHFFDQPFDYQLCLSSDHQHESPDDTHEVALEWIAEASKIFRDDDPNAYVIGELSEVFAMQHLNVSWIWEMSILAPEIMRYTCPEALIYLIVDRQPEILNRAFALGTLVAFTTCELEKTLVDYPAFANRVAQLASLRKRTSTFTTRGTFRYKHGLSATTGIHAYIFESPQGLGIIVADESNQSREVHLSVDLRQYPALQARQLHTTWYSQDGKSTENKHHSSTQTIELSFTLPALEVAVWTIEKTH